MADLIVNVWLRRKLYGPGNLPPEDLWPEVPAEAWDEVPEHPPVVTPQEQSLTGNGGGEATAESQAGSPGAAQPGVGGDAPGTGDDDAFAGLLGDSLQPPAPSPLEQLGRLPDDKDVLAGFAQAHGIEVDGRKGPAKLRAEIAGALAERTTP